MANDYTELAAKIRADPECIKALGELAKVALEIYYSGAVNSAPLLFKAAQAYEIARNPAGNDTKQPEFAPYRLIMARLVDLAGMYLLTHLTADEDVKLCEKHVLAMEAQKL